MPQPRTFERCGDMIIEYLSKVAPEYDKTIQTIGFVGGGMPALDVARYINLTYQDVRYFVNRVTMIHFHNRLMYELKKNVDLFLSSRIGGELCWLDNYVAKDTFGYSDGDLIEKALNVAFDTYDKGDNLQWYKNSLTTPSFNNYNNGLVAGAYWSVTGEGKDYQFPVDDGNLYNLTWYGNSNAGRMKFDDRFENSKILPLH